MGVMLYPLVGYGSFPLDLAFMAVIALLFLRREELCPKL